MNNKQIDALIRKCEPVMLTVDTGLYFRIAKGNPSWVVKYTLGGKRSQIALPEAYPHCSIAQAKKIAAEIRSQVNTGIDPKSKRQQDKQEVIRNVDDLFQDWYDNDISKRLKHPSIPHRIYRKELKPYIGKLSIKDVNPRNIRSIIQAIMDSQRRSTANQALMYAKQLFRHAVKLNLITYNPAQAFTQSDAGGVCEGRVRALNIDELETVFRVFREQQNIFTRENYLACCLLLSLGVRKGELISAKWQDFDIKKRLWNMPAENKTGVAITIPLPPACMPWLEELYIRACGADYLFPSRRASKRRSYISDDTLNHALAKLFGLKVDGNKQPYDNLLGNAGIEHFTIHDLRRTCRSLLAVMDIQGHVAERCLNHKLKGVEGIYNRHDYLPERKEALEKLANSLAPIFNYQEVDFKNA
ncbi:tyrosine-type recombinase/integrase [Moritella yayanosii]|uniref:Phage integrase family protein n=1 Tax=Moritella yayanosii TaxID=69539 RepID=A0A330LSA2_9GAMM|nr:site-specific integrase [Moritella yayanosii]SQD79603.1 Phage integrase family protein [Moritella yayanosii]